MQATPEKWKKKVSLGEPDSGLLEIFRLLCRQVARKEMRWSHPRQRYAGMRGVADKSGIPIAGFSSYLVGWLFL
jgi:hypothetical protein